MFFSFVFFCLFISIDAHLNERSLSVKKTKNITIHCACVCVLSPIFIFHLSNSVVAFETKEEREKKSRSYIIGTRPIVVVISISSNYSSSSLLFLFSVSLNRLEYDIAKREEEE